MPTINAVRSVVVRGLARVGLVVVSVAIALLAGEALVRLFGLEPPQLMVRDTVLGQTYRPYLNAVLFDEEAGRRIAVSINSHGFRDSEHDAVAPAGVRRVVMLGDSFQAGLSVDADATFPRVAERLLGHTASDRWEVVSMGVPGFGTAQELLSYEQFGRPVRPTVVVLNFFAGNDVSDNSPELSTSLRPYFRLEDGRLILSRVSESRRKLTNWLNEHSRLYVWQKRVGQKVERLVRRNVVVDPVMRVFMSQPGAAVDRAWTVTEALVLELRRAVEADGARLLVSYIPFSDEVNADWWDEVVTPSPTLADVAWDVDGPSRRLAEFCRRNGIPFSSARDVLRNQGDTRFYFKHGHFNERGHEAYARYLVPQIRALGAGR